MNIENKELYEKYKKEHLDDNGEVPEQYALSELVLHAIKNKSYKMYCGGGYEHNTNNEIKMFDVVCYVNFSSNPYFMVCVDNTEGDCCDLVRCNDRCEIEKLLV